MPTVSVVIPTYNRAFVIGDAIRSVLEQTFQDFEIIVVDDGSTDNTAEVVKSFNDDRIRYIRLDKNRGAAAARNVGTRESKGEYIAFLDSDDLWLPTKLEKQLEVFKKSNPGVGVVYCDIFVLLRHRVYVVKRRDKGHIYSELLGGAISTPSLLIRREILKDVGGWDESFPAVQDRELELRISKKYGFEYVDSIEVVVRAFSKGVSYLNNPNRILGLNLFMKKYLKDLLANKQAMGKTYIEMAHSYCRIGKCNIGIKYMLKAVSLGYVKPTVGIMLLVAMFGSDIYNIIWSIYQTIHRLFFKVWGRKRIPKNIMEFLMRYERNKRLLGLSK